MMLIIRGKQSKLKTTEKFIKSSEEEITKGITHII